MKGNKSLSSIFYLMPDTIPCRIGIRRWRLWSIWRSPRPRPRGTWPRHRTVSCSSCWGASDPEFRSSTSTSDSSCFPEFKILPLSGVFLLLYLWRDSSEHIPPKLVNEVAEGEEGNPLESHIEQNIDICFLNSKLTQLNFKHLSVRIPAESW